MAVVRPENSKIEIEAYGDGVMSELTPVENKAYGDGVMQEFPAVENTKRGVSRWHTCIFVTLVLGTIFGIFWGLGETGQLGSLWPSNGPWPSLNDFMREDPYNSSTPEEADKWSNSGRGLSLEVQFAAEDKWYSHFVEAVEAWENGTPDSLTLSTRNVTVDPACDFSSGTIKVCNDNYGRTGWRGLNTVVVVVGRISASIAQLNEFYLARARHPERQYTMW